jgi:1D-myo-inositol 3-kinase
MRTIGAVSAPDFVAVGHVTLDRFGNAVRPGGSALYAAVTAHRLGISAGILTSHADDFPLETIPPQIEVITMPSPVTTTFMHVVEPGRRRALVSAHAAAPLQPDAIPEDWRDARLVLLAPVLGEVAESFAAAFPEATVAADAQGWLRGRRADGTVTSATWERADQVLKRIQALFLSEEDVAEDPGGALEWFQRLPLGVLTAAGRGAALFVNGERYEVRAYPAREVDATGAGDVFAAAFVVDYDRYGDAWDAAATAACAAGLSVEGEAFSMVPTAARLKAAVEEYRRDAARLDTGRTGNYGERGG